MARQRSTLWLFTVCCLPFFVFLGIVLYVDRLTYPYIPAKAKPFDQNKHNEKIGGPPPTATEQQNDLPPLGKPAKDPDPVKDHAKPEFKGPPVTDADNDDLPSHAPFLNVSHAATQPPAGGVRKAIVAAGLTGDNITWMSHFFPDWEHHVYVMDDRNNNSVDLTVERNHGHEGSAYLTYLIDNYHALPDYIVFLHARRYQWHHDDPMYDGMPVIRDLRLPQVDARGYLSLRCTHKPGCTDGIAPLEHPGPADPPKGIRASYANAWSSFFPTRPVPPRVRAHCCGQFAVSAAQVRKRPRDAYRRYRAFLWDVDLDDQTAGTLYEYMWHVFFQQKVDGCQPAGQCFCENFGRCNLTCPDETRCLGRWKQPPLGASLPEGWPEHGQGEKGWLREGWWNEEIRKYKEIGVKKVKEKPKPKPKKKEKERMPVKKKKLP